MLFLFLQSLLLVVYVTGQQKASIASCVRGSTATEIIATFRVKINGADITELLAYDQAGSTPQTGACTTTTIISDILELVLTFDTGALSCGIEQDGTTATQYNIRVHAKGTSTNQPYTFHCDSTSLLSDSVSAGPLEVKGGLNTFGLYDVSRDVYLQALVSDTQSPATTIELGRQITFRIVFNRGTESFANTNWGTSFHVGFLRTLPDAVLSVDIYTPGYSTKVTVKGILTGFEVDETVIVSQDEPIRITIPSEYQPLSTTTDWGSGEDKAIEIVSATFPIGVRVNSEQSAGMTDSYIAYPDDVTGASGANTYRLPTMADAEYFRGLDATAEAKLNYFNGPFKSGTTKTATDAQAIVVAIEDETVLVMNPDSVIPLAGTPTMYPVTIDKGALFHISCEFECDVFSLDTNKPVAVITGNGVNVSPEKDGHAMSPTLSTSQFGRKFAIITPRNDLSTVAFYKVLTDTVEFTTSTTWHHASATNPGAGVPLNDGTPPIAMLALDNAYHAEMLTVDPAGAPPAATVTQTFTGTATFGPTMMTVPPVDQWGTEQTVPVRGDTLYDFVIIHAMDDIATDLRFSSNLFDAQLDIVSTLADLGTPENTFSEAVLTAPAQSDDYVMQWLQFGSHVDLKWVKLEAVNPKDAFMLAVYEINADNTVNAITGFGQRAPPSTTTCTPIAAAAGVYPGMLKGDGIDNDCDGNVDEEVANGIDDDGDHLIDEDLSSLSADGLWAVYNKGLEIATDEAFTSPVEIIDANGCNKETSTHVTSVGHFKGSMYLNMGQPDYWTIFTNNFPAFRIRNEPTLWVRASVGYCETATGLCVDSCDTTRKRRDVSDVRRRETVYLRLNVIDPAENSTDASYDVKTPSCKDDVIFWSATITLLVVILSEIGFIALLLKKRFQLM